MASGRRRAPGVRIPADALVLLIGAAGSGKSTFAAAHFVADEILSSDNYRALIGGDPTDQIVNDEAFARLHAELERRLATGQRTVVDATNVEAWARRPLRTAADRHQRPVVAIVLAVPLETSLARNAARGGRRVPSSAVRRQDRILRATLPRLSEEGYAELVVLTDADEVDRLSVRRPPVRRAASKPGTTKRPEGTAPGPLMQSPEPSPGP